MRHDRPDAAPCELGSTTVEHVAAARRVGPPADTRRHRRASMASAVGPSRAVGAGMPLSQRSRASTPPGRARSPRTPVACGLAAQAERQADHRCHVDRRRRGVDPGVGSRPARGRRCRMHVPGPSIGSVTGVCGVHRRAPTTAQVDVDGSVPCARSKLLDRRTPIAAGRRCRRTQHPSRREPACESDVTSRCDRRRVRAPSSRGRLKTARRTRQGGELLRDRRPTAVPSTSARTTWSPRRTSGRVPQSRRPDSGGPTGARSPPRGIGPPLDRRLHLNVVHRAETAWRARRSGTIRQAANASRRGYPDRVTAIARATVHERH